jgi:hypothetical protein
MMCGLKTQICKVRISSPADKVPRPMDETILLFRPQRAELDDCVTELTCWTNGRGTSGRSISRISGRSWGRAGMCGMDANDYARA